MFLANYIGDVAFFEVYVAFFLVHAVFFWVQCGGAVAMVQWCGCAGAVVRWWWCSGTVVAVQWRGGGGATVVSWVCSDGARRHPLGLQPGSGHAITWCSTVQNRAHIFDAPAFLLTCLHTGTELIEVEVMNSELHRLSTAPEGVNTIQK